MTTPEPPALADNPDVSATNTSARETALREILEVISASRGDEQPVFEVILKHSRALCKAPMAGLVLGQAGDDHQILAAEHGLEESMARIYWDGGVAMDPETSFAARAILSGRPLHFANMADTDEYRSGAPIVTTMVDDLGIRTVLFVPLQSGDGCIGAIVLFRQEVRPFTDSQIALVETFAEQAVIAIENVRQYRELQTRLEREQATREILEVISQSRADEMPVLSAIVRNAARLCDATLAGLWLVNEARTHLQYACTWGEDKGVFKIGHEFDLNGPLQLAVTIREARIIHTPDLSDDPLYEARDPMRVKVVEEAGLRTFLTVPLIRDGVAFGCLNLNRFEVRPFDDADIALVETFAAQAVIAIENVRQFRELQTRLEREEATREILQVISASRADDGPVFDVILRNAGRLCGAPMASMAICNDERTHLVMQAHWGDTLTHLAVDQTNWPLDGPTSNAVAVREQRIVHTEDLKDTDAYRDGDPGRAEAVDKEGIRTFLAVPLLADGLAIGCIALYRREVQPFDDSQIELVQSFAEQAVIAIENVRQFKALEALNAELGDRVSEQVEEIERMGRLKRFLSPQVADAVISSGDDNLLGSHRAMIAILFCDIRGFTAFCESAEPEETIEVLQTFHETLGRLIHAAGAGFDHRAGDGIMVVFNDPVPCEDPVGAALRVAVQMRENMVEICTKWRKLGHRMGFGVGISLGYATVGMVGFEGRFDYTASGTAVNLAARLCDQAADQEILLSQRAATALEDIAEIESAGELTLKGFHAPVDVFRVSQMKETQ